jgi:putative salt-induced outer membrane protein YdiY
MRRLLPLVLLLASTGLASGQSPEQPKEPPPLWDAQIGASFIGTSGNTDTGSTGVDFAAHRRGVIWGFESTATLIRTTDNGQTTAERYLGAFRVKRNLSDRVGVSIGEKAERDRFSGIDFRNIADAALSWKLVSTPKWTLDGISGVGWNHEARIEGEDLDDPVGVLQVLSRLPFGTAGDSTQRFTFYPDLTRSSAFRHEAEVTAQAALAAHFALKFGYLLRYSNDPVPGFKKTDNTATASVVVRWKASSPAPASAR